MNDYPQYHKETEWIPVYPIVNGYRYSGYVGAQVVVQSDGETWTQLNYWGEIYKRIVHDRQSECHWEHLVTVPTPTSIHLQACVLFCPHCRQVKADARWDFI